MSSPGAVEECAALVVARALQIDPFVRSANHPGNERKQSLEVLVHIRRVRLWISKNLMQDKHCTLRGCQDLDI